MIKECKTHGFFRAKICPVCGEDGMFIMNRMEVEYLSRVMAGCLRHFPEKYELKMDPHGWVDIKEFVNGVRRKRRELHWLSPLHIQALIATEPKGRYQQANNMIRATYGHTLDIELDLPTNNIPDSLYYPATPEEIDLLLETGLKPIDRKKVHLSKTIANAIEAGRSRVDNPLVLEIDIKTAISDGIVIQKAAPTVFLTNEIPAKYLKKIDAMGMVGHDIAKQINTDQSDTSTVEEQDSPEVDDSNRHDSNIIPDTKNGDTGN